MTTTITERDGWLHDENGNRNSISYWGSREAAERALLSLKNCHNCVNCLDCSDCSGCSDKRGVKGDNGDHAQPPVPIIPDIHKAVYAAASQEGALNMGNWHTCDTTHCRAGWVTHLAGEEGKALEAYWGTAHAAWMIYRASDPDMRGRPNFYASDEDALADMKRLAETEAA